MSSRSFLYKLGINTTARGVAVVIIILLVIRIIFSVDIKFLIGLKQPNIVFILADDLGYNDIGYVRNDTGVISTPFLDKLAETGVKLEYSYTQPICSASRAAILTGRYPFRYGFQRVAIANDEIAGLDNTMKLMPERLKELGYQTHIVGKWHLGYCKKGYTPLYKGFDTFRGYLSGSESYYSHLIRRKFYDYWYNENVLWNSNYSTSDYAEYTSNLIRENTDSRPMFLYLAMQAPHKPFEAPPGEIDDETDNYKYNRMVETLDTFTKRVYSAFEEKGMLDNTIFIFSSDNGASPLAGSNWPLRGFKQDLFEGGTRVRAFINGPGIEQGTFTGLFHSVDWYPTILKMAGSSDVTDIDGVDQLDAIVNKRDWEGQPRRQFIYDINQKTEKDGNVVHSGGIRFRTMKDDGTIRDLKLLYGLPGPSESLVNYGSEGVVFDLAKDEREKRPMRGYTMDREILLDIIKKEKEKQYQPHIYYKSEMAFEMTDENEKPIMAPGWC